MTIPDGGYTIIRFLADNPGYWLFHCHIEFHAEIGMALIFKVGEHREMLSAPANFPQCGDYIPTSESIVQPSSGKTLVPAFSNFILIISILFYCLI